jgi:hypothetical protein
MEAARTSETLVNFYQTTRRYNPEDSHLHTHRRENLKSYLINPRLWSRRTVSAHSEGKVEYSGCIAYSLIRVLKGLNDMRLHVCRRSEWGKDRLRKLCLNWDRRSVVRLHWIAQASNNASRPQCCMLLNSTFTSKAVQVAISEDFRSPCVCFTSDIQIRLRRLYSSLVFPYSSYPIFSSLSVALPHAICKILDISFRAPSPTVLCFVYNVTTISGFVMFVFIRRRRSLRSPKILLLFHQCTLIPHLVARLHILFSFIVGLPMNRTVSLLKFETWFLALSLSLDHSLNQIL